MQFVFYNKTNTVFIAGGTGITPFLSLFAYKSYNEYIDPKIYLGFRSKDYNIYENELTSVRLRAIREEFVTIRLSYQDSDGISTSKAFSPRTAPNRTTLSQAHL